MIEILALFVLVRTIGSILREKGRKAAGYGVLAVVAQFVGEIIGAILGLIVTDALELGGCLLYIFALTGGAVGVGVVFWSVSSLPPELTQDETKVLKLWAEGFDDSLIFPALLSKEEVFPLEAYPSTL